MTAENKVDPEKFKALLRKRDSYIGEMAAYRRLLALAVADEIGPCRRVARDLTYDCREAIIGMSAADLYEHPDDIAVEWVFEICKEENRK